MLAHLNRFEFGTVACDICTGGAAHNLHLTLRGASADGRAPARSRSHTNTHHHFSALLGRRGQAAESLSTACCSRSATPGPACVRSHLDWRSQSTPGTPNEPLSSPPPHRVTGRTGPRRAAEDGVRPSFETVRPSGGRCQARGRVGLTR